jgi:SAM-dependent methyltransferase
MNEREALRSYSASGGLRGALGQWRNLRRHHRRGLDWRVGTVVEEARKIEEEVFEQTEMVIEGRRVLDIGPGQQLMQMAYFAARGNDVVGVDRDAIVWGFDPAAYLRMARSNGVGRMVKTAGRKALGIDRDYRRELERQSGLQVRALRMTVHQRNAWDTRLQSESFDFVYSLRTFMHLHEPEAALHEAVRLLAPGGVAYIKLMPYTAPYGSLDIRVLGGGGDDLPPWAHLRPQHLHRVRESAYLNHLSLSQWQRLLSKAMPGCNIRLAQPDVERLRPLAQELHAQSELLEFAVDDLLTSAVHVTWCKTPAVVGGRQDDVRRSSATPATR